MLLFATSELHPVQSLLHGRMSLRQLPDMTIFETASCESYQAHVFTSTEKSALSRLVGGIVWMPRTELNLSSNSAQDHRPVTLAPTSIHGAYSWTCNLCMRTSLSICYMVNTYVGVITLPHERPAQEARDKQNSVLSCSSQSESPMPAQRRRRRSRLAHCGNVSQLHSLNMPQHSDAECS